MPITSARLNRAITGLTGLLLLLVAGFAHALTLEAVDDSFGVPFGKSLQVEAFGVLENDILDGQSAGENGATAVLVSGVSSGTLSCPTDTTVLLCADGSFEYTPGISYSGTDSFTYQAVFNGVISAPATVTLTACSGGPDVFSCWKESSYLTKLMELGYGTFVESFEGVAWDSVRSTFDTTNSAPSITSQGITWTTNHPGTNEITTGTGPARTGMYGGYDPNHGHATGSFTECDVDTPPASCLFHDGLSGKILTGGDALHGVGGYITGLTTGTKIAIILDGTTQINVGTLPDLGHHFFGLIDAKPAGFTGFEFRELDGKIGQERYIWGDDFIIAALGILSAPVANAGVDQTVLVGGTVTLDGSGSTDADSDPLTYSWIFSTMPADSTATLDITDPLHPTFVADVSGNYEVQLIVNDGLLDSLPDTVSISTSNSAPVANAGLDQSAPVGNTVTLDGSGSTDADGDTLSYGWSFTSVPVGSTAVLDITDPVHPTFVIDLPGTYVAQLIVNDGLLDSLPDTVSISTTNSAPVANAGADQSAPVGNTVTLDGSASNDVDGDALTYSWSFTSVPAGSTAVLDTTDPVHPTFDVDLFGTYVAQLIVNDGLLDSAADTVSISTTNSAPVANAGADQSAPVGNTVTLDGSASNDVDGDALTYSWSFTSVPAGSTAALDTTDPVHPTFVIDLPGTYVAQLIVNDGLLDSLPDTVSISTTNSAPVANAGADQSAPVASTVTLDGSGSSDADGDVLSYSWSLTSQPAGSTVTLSDPTVVKPIFVADVVGVYEVQLVVNDGLLDSLPDTVTITTSDIVPVTNGLPVVLLQYILEKGRQKRNGGG